MTTTQNKQTKASGHRIGCITQIVSVLSRSVHLLGIIFTLSRISRLHSSGEYNVCVCVCVCTQCLLSQCQGGWGIEGGSHKSSARSGLQTKARAVAMPTPCMCTQTGLCLHKHASPDYTALTSPFPDLPALQRSMVAPEVKKLIM